LYNAFLAGVDNPLGPLPIQYADFAAWQRGWLQGETLDSHVAAWKRLLAHAQPLHLPVDHERPGIETFHGASHHFLFPAEISGPLRSITHKQGATLFMTLLAGFKALMQRYTGQEHIVLGAPIANRNRGEVEGLIGFFVNSLVLCTNVGGDPTFLELLARVRQVALEAYTHQDLPFEKLVEELQPQRYLNQNPLFQVAFAMQQNKAMKPTFQLRGAEAAIVDLPRIDVRFDMEVHLWEDGEVIRGYIVYNADLFESSTIERISAHYVRLLKGVAENPEIRLSSLEYMSEEELNQLEAWN
jgi:non-ribosomal peptide synthetase component F